MTRRLLLLTLLALPAFAADVTGNWTFQVDLGGQGGSPKFTFQQKGETLTGTYNGQLGSAKLTGTVKGETVEGIVKVGEGASQQSLPWTAKMVERKAGPQ